MNFIYWICGRKNAKTIFAVLDGTHAAVKKNPAKFSLLNFNTTPTR